jgi:hypothetical protein
MSNACQPGQKAQVVDSNGKVAAVVEIVSIGPGDFHGAPYGEEVALVKFDTVQDSCAAGNIGLACDWQQHNLTTTRSSLLNITMMQQIQLPVEIPIAMTHLRLLQPEPQPAKRLKGSRAGARASCSILSGDAIR